MMFRNREEAARLLADHLERYRQHPLVPTSRRFPTTLLTTT